MKLRELANRLNELADAHGDLGVESQIAVQNPHVVSAPVDFTLYATRKDDGSNKAVVVLGSFAAMRYDFPEEAEVVEATDDEIRAEFVKRFGEPDFSTATDDQFRHQYIQRFGVPADQTFVPSREDTEELAADLDEGLDKLATLSSLKIGGKAVYSRGDQIVTIVGRQFNVHNEHKYLIQLPNKRKWVTADQVRPLKFSERISEQSLQAMRAQIRGGI